MIVVHVVLLGFIAIGIIAVVAFCIRATLLAHHLRGVLSLQGRNEPEVATANFVEAVGHADKSLIIHDDGNNMADSLYNDPDAIEALVNRMNEHEAIRVKCWFNVESVPELGLVAAIRKDSRLATRFEIRYRKPTLLELWRLSWLDPHYKIADGEFGTLSNHAFGSGRRRFRIEDCTRASAKGRDITLGPFMRRFDRGFEKGSRHQHTANDGPHTQCGRALAA